MANSLAKIGTQRLSRWVLSMSRPILTGLKASCSGILVACVSAADTVTQSLDIAKHGSTMHRDGNPSLNPRSSSSVSQCQRKTLTSSSGNPRCKTTCKTHNQLPTRPVRLTNREAAWRYAYRNSNSLKSAKKLLQPSTRAHG